MTDPAALNNALSAMFRAMMEQSAAAASEPPETPSAPPAEPAGMIAQAEALAQLGDAFRVMYGSQRAKVAPRRQRHPAAELRRHDAICAAEHRVTLGWVAQYSGLSAATMCAGAQIG